MLRRYTFWLTAAILFQFVTAVLHSLSLFITQQPANDTERELLTLTTTYRIDAGAGFYPSYSNLFTALSSCFSFVCLLGGLTLGYLMIKQTDASLMRGLIAINLAIFGAIFLVMAWFTFLPPIVFSGLIFVNLLAAYITVQKIETTH